MVVTRAFGAPTAGVFQKSIGFGEAFETEKPRSEVFLIHFLELPNPSIIKILLFNKQLYHLVDDRIVDVSTALVDGTDQKAANFHSVPPTVCAMSRFMLALNRRVHLTP
jgi:hypothetical protein